MSRKTISSLKPSSILSNFFTIVVAHVVHRTLAHVRAEIRTSIELIKNMILVLKLTATLVVIKEAVTSKRIPSSEIMADAFVSKTPS